MAKGKPEIRLTDEQVEIIDSIMKENNSVIITPQVLEKILQKLKMSRLQLSRRAGVINKKIFFGLSWEEWKQSKNAQKKIYIQFYCKHCNQLSAMMVVGLLARRKLLKSCKKCYFKHDVFDDEWKEKNSKAQKISQNKKETLEKHRLNSKRMWELNREKMMNAVLKTVKDPSYKIAMSKTMSKKWETDEAYRDSVCGKGYFSKNGFYEKIYYHSLSELAFILKCEQTSTKIKRCDFFIDYKINNKDRKYFPDFLVNEKKIVEIKGRYWTKNNKHDEFMEKTKALKEYCKNAGLDYEIIYSDEIEKNFIKEAKKYNEANSKKRI